MLRQSLCKILLAGLLSTVLSLQAAYIAKAGNSAEEDTMTKIADINASQNQEKQLVLAGGCFWGVQEYFSRIPGVFSAEAGYAQSQKANPGYEEVCSGSTGACEAVLIKYDPRLAPLSLLLKHYFKIIDPLAHNRQGNDVGTQYRTGIFYLNQDDKPEIDKIMAEVAAKVGKPLAVETGELKNFYRAEDYHQDYLKKNPGGYCHISFASLNDPALKAYERPDDASLKATLEPESYNVTRQNGTERPFTGKYNEFSEPGIYVDIVSGQPLFASDAKFKSSCGWPAFARPIANNAVKASRDLSHGMDRIEIRSSLADSHLGHVFNDGPKELGGLRFCINSAALRFIPLKDMDKEGYGAYKKFVK